VDEEHLFFCSQNAREMLAFIREDKKRINAL